MRRYAFAALTAASLAVITPRLFAQQLDANQQLAKDIYKELLEYNTSNMTSGMMVCSIWSW